MARLAEPPPQRRALSQQARAVLLADGHRLSPVRGQRSVGPPGLGAGRRAGGRRHRIVGRDPVGTADRAPRRHRPPHRSRVRSARPVLDARHDDDPLDHARHVRGRSVRRRARLVAGAGSRLRRRGPALEGPDRSRAHRARRPRRADRAASTVASHAARASRRRRRVPRHCRSLACGGRRHRSGLPAPALRGPAVEACRRRWPPSPRPSPAVLRSRAARRILPVEHASAGHAARHVPA